MDSSFFEAFFPASSLLFFFFFLAIEGAGDGEGDGPESLVDPGRVPLRERLRVATAAAVRRVAGAGADEEELLADVFWVAFRVAFDGTVVRFEVEPL